MSAWGLGHILQGKASLRADRTSVAIGEKVTLHFEVSADASHPQPQALEVDYLVHHIKANGSTSPKAFKGKRLTLAPGETARWDKLHSFVPVSTRRYVEGPHRIDLQINGQVMSHTDVSLVR